MFLRDDSLRMPLDSVVKSLIRWWLALNDFVADLRGRDESALMQEWFQLVHEKNALSRYEQELMVSARELELEDRHARLQLELKDSMSLDGTFPLLSKEWIYLNSFYSVVQFYSIAVWFENDFRWFIA